MAAASPQAAGIEFGALAPSNALNGVLNLFVEPSHEAEPQVMAPVRVIWY